MTGLNRGVTVLNQRSQFGRTSKLDTSQLSEILDHNDINLTEQNQTDDYFDINQMNGYDSEELD